MSCGEGNVYMMTIIGKERVCHAKWILSATKKLMCTNINSWRLGLGTK